MVLIKNLKEYKTNFKPCKLDVCYAVWKPLRSLSPTVPGIGRDTVASHVCSTADITDVLKLKYCQIISKLVKEGYVRQDV